MPAPAVGQNPPAGVVVHYYLKETPKEPVTLEFLEANGTVVKNFRSVAEQRPRAEDPPAAFAGPGAGQRTVPARAGMNRFVWDLRYPDAVGPPLGVLLFGGNMRGPVAVPGTYQVRLTVDGRTLTETFEIKKDPRLTTTDEDYRKQFDLLIKIRDQVTASHEAVNTILKAREEIGPIVTQAKANPRYREIALKGQQLDDRLGAVQDELIQMKIRFGNDVLTYPIKLNNKIAALAGVVAGADATPTTQAVEVFQMLSAQLAAQLAKLEPILRTDVPALQALARKRGLRVAPK